MQFLKKMLGIRSAQPPGNVWAGGHCVSRTTSRDKKAPFWKGDDCGLGGSPFVLAKRSARNSRLTLQLDSVVQSLFHSVSNRRILAWGIRFSI